MASANTFLGGASGRLLEASIPFRFFAAAVLFHLLAWLALAWAGPDIRDFVGGLGWTLAGLHLLTLGVLVMTALGASLQLLPVATRQPVMSQRWPYELLWGLYVLGVMAVVAGMALWLPTLLWLGALAVALALLLYLGLLALNLRGAKGMPLVVLHGWVAALSLLVLLASALSLAGLYSGIILIERTAAIGLHVSFAAYGVMGLLVMGFSYILVPMFALADNPAPAWSQLSLGLALLALLVALLVLLGLVPPLLFRLAIVAGALAFLIHVALMEQALRSGMRRNLGTSFVLVRLGWACLAASFALALALEMEIGLRHAAVLFGILLIGGLLTLLLGVLSRIVPFLAAMHAGAGMRRPPTPSNMTAQRPLDIHLYCHSAALALLLAGVLFDSAWLLRGGTLAGIAGAVAYAAFFLHTWRRMRQMLASKAQPVDSKSAH